MLKLLTLALLLPMICGADTINVGRDDIVLIETPFEGEIIFGDHGLVLAEPTINMNDWPTGTEVFQDDASVTYFAHVYVVSKSNRKYELVEDSTPILDSTDIITGWDHTLEYRPIGEADKRIVFDKPSSIAIDSTPDSPPVYKKLTGHGLRHFPPPNTGRNTDIIWGWWCNNYTKNPDIIDMKWNPQIIDSVKFWSKNREITQNGEGTHTHYFLPDTGRLVTVWKEIECENGKCDTTSLAADSGMYFSFSNRYNDYSLKHLPVTYRLTSCREVADTTWLWAFKRENRHYPGLQKFPVVTTSVICDSAIVEGE